MKRDKTLLLLGAQLLLMTGLIALEAMNQPQRFLRGALFIAVGVITVILLLMRLRFRAKLTGMTAALKRAKMFVVSLIGAAAAPTMVFIGYLDYLAQKPGMPVLFSEAWSQTNLYTTPAYRDAAVRRHHRLSVQP